MTLIFYLFFMVINRFSVIICYSKTKYEDNPSKDDIETTTNATNEIISINLDTMKFPEFFDARLKWGDICPSIYQVANQGKCKSGWAIAITSTMTDRLCIESLGNKHLSMSAMMLLTCCQNCCGCRGGNVLNAWMHVRDTGLYTGSMSERTPLQHADGCQPYLIKPLKKSELHKSSTQCFQTPMCIKSKCTNSNFQPLKEKPVYFKIDNFRLLSRHNPRAIMRELYENGPLQVSFHFYEDFREYKTINGQCPVYTHVWGKHEGEQSGKLIGWGTQDNIKYWIVVNSFSKNWGCNGTFRIERNKKNDLEFGYFIIAPSFSKNGAISLLPITVLRWIIFSLIYKQLISNFSITKIIEGVFQIMLQF